MTTIIRNRYRNGEFHSTEIVGTFAEHHEAEHYMEWYVLEVGSHKQIAPCGYERLDAEGRRAEHIIITDSKNRSRDINGRWITS
jgi:hypothetical protein